eukprot:2363876-Alexandrium_andersonii.AAC.1
MPNSEQQQTTRKFQTLAIGAESQNRKSPKRALPPHHDSGAVPWRVLHVNRRHTGAAEWLYA